MPQTVVAWEDRAESRNDTATKTIESLDSISQALLPLVSVIVTNYNYGAFIGQSVRSVFAQTYPNIECILVDDRSTDNSRQVIDELAKRFPDLRTVENETNGGQSVSMLNGLQRASGPYIVFLDADDYLLPGCIETHIAVHLKSRIAVGFTSVDMLQVTAEGIITETSHGFSDFVLAARRESRDGPCPVNGGDSSGEVAKEIMRQCDEPVYYVHPRETKHWPWSATSANCFRRDALDMILQCEGFRDLKSCSDIFLLRGIGVLSGSILIDRPLAAYRIHGSNDFIRNATLNQVRIFNPTHLEPRSHLAVRLLLSLFVEECTFFTHRLLARNYLFDAIMITNDLWPPLPRSPLGIGHLTELLIEHRKTVMKALGYQLYVRALMQSVLPKVRATDIRGFFLAVPVFLIVLPALLALRSFGRLRTGRARKA